MNKEADKRKRGVRMLGLGFLTLLVVLTVIAIIMQLRGSMPSHWDQQQARIAALSQDQRKAMSEGLRNRLLTEWSDAEAELPTSEEELFGQRRTLEIPYEQLNVWMAEEGPQLLAQIDLPMPKYVRAAMVDSDGEGNLRISCDVKTSKLEQVIALTFAIDVADDGIVNSKLVSASAGKLPLPKDVAIDLIAKRTDGKSVLLGLMEGTPVGPFELPIDASKTGRDGRLVGLEVRDDALVITRETVRRKNASE